jgi:hypothetical protein
METRSRFFQVIKLSCQIYADDERCAKLKYVEGQRVYKTSCRSDTTEYRLATNIRIMAAEGTYLTLCEVQVCERVTHIFALFFGLEKEIRRVITCHLQAF